MNGIEMGTHLNRSRSSLKHKTGANADWNELKHFFQAQMRATALADAHRYVLYSGTRGPGKNYGLRWYLLRRLLEFSSRGLAGVHVGLFCETYPAL
jgi:hypothetical protein